MLSPRQGVDSASSESSAARRSPKTPKGKRAAQAPLMLVLTGSATTPPPERVKRSWTHECVIPSSLRVCNNRVQLTAF